MAILEHRGECVALWMHVPAEHVIACTACRARYESTPERRFAVLFEQVLTGHMQRLADDGAVLLEAERKRGTPPFLGDGSTEFEC